MEVKPTGKSKRKRQAFTIGDLHTCVCEETADPQSDNDISCKQMGKLFTNINEVEQH